LALSRAAFLEADSFAYPALLFSSKAAHIWPRILPVPPKGSKKVEKSETKTVKKAKSDKPKVPRAPSPYILFCNDKRAEIKVTHPQATFGETGKILGQMWAALDEKSKAGYAKESASRKAALDKANA